MGWSGRRVLGRAGGAGREGGGPDARGTFEEVEEEEVFASTAVLVAARPDDTEPNGTEEEGADARPDEAEPDGTGDEGAESAGREELSDMMMMVLWVVLVMKDVFLLLERLVVLFCY